jgi:hypothetical protein
MSLLFTTPTGEILELTPGETSAAAISSTTTSQNKNEVPSNPSSTEVDLTILFKYGELRHLDSCTDTAALPPPQNSDEKRAQRSSCGSSSPLIKIVNPDEELLSMYIADPPQAPEASPRRHESKSGSIAKVPMAYNETGELVEESSFRHYPTPDELNATQLLRVIKKAAHHTVSNQPN